MERGAWESLLNSVGCQLEWLDHGLLAARATVAIRAFAWVGTDLTAGLATGGARLVALLHAIDAGIVKPSMRLALRGKETGYQKEGSNSRVTGQHARMPTR